MKKRKALSAAAAVLAALTLLAGCKNTDNGQSSAPSAPESSSSSQESSKTENKSDEFSAESKTGESSADNSKPESKTDESSAENSKTESSQESDTQKQDTISPAVWEVTDQNGNSIYMMGSIHLAKEEAVHLPGYFETAYADCTALAVECDVSDISISQISALNKILYSDGTKIYDHVPKEDYEKAKKNLQNENAYMSAYDYYKPIMWAQLAELSAASKAGLNANYGADTVMLKRAKDEGKEILELESVEFQYDVLAGISDEVQLMLFNEIADPNYMEKSSEQLEKLFDLWKTGKLDESILSPEEENLTPEQKKLVDEYNKLLISDRNKGMANKIKGYIQSGKKVMVIAGSAHFYGDEGIVKLLENDGYTIRQLTSADADSSVKTESSVSSLPLQSSAPAAETDPGIPRAA